MFQDSSNPLIYQVLISKAVELRLHRTRTKRLVKSIEVLAPKRQQRFQTLSVPEVRIQIVWWKHSSQGEAILFILAKKKGHKIGHYLLKHYSPVLTMDILCSHAISKEVTASLRAHTKTTLANSRILVLDERNLATHTTWFMSGVYSQAEFSAYKKRASLKTSVPLWLDDRHRSFLIIQSGISSLFWLVPH